jgi:uncharacterized protein (DUF1810 family)
MVGKPASDDIGDPYDLNRFVQAQQGDYARALAEIKRGRKTSHWMWYVFPQFLGLGQSSMSRRYAIRSAAEARAYLAHPILGLRLRECFAALLALEGHSAHQIFGSPDDLKLNSCATLFAHVSGAGSEFKSVLEKYFDGTPDDTTLKLMAAAGGD